MDKLAYLYHCNFMHVHINVLEYYEMVFSKQDTFYVMYSQLIIEKYFPMEQNQALPFMKVKTVWKVNTWITASSNYFCFNWNR